MKILHLCIEDLILIMTQIQGKKCFRARLVWRSVFTAALPVINSFAYTPFLALPWVNMYHIYPTGNHIRGKNWSQMARIGQKWWKKIGISFLVSNFRTSDWTDFSVVWTIFFLAEPHLFINESMCCCLEDHWACQSMAMGWNSQDPGLTVKKWIFVPRSRFMAFEGEKGVS